MTDGQFTLLFLIVCTVFEGVFRLPLGTWLFQKHWSHFGRQLSPFFRTKDLGVGVSIPFSSAPLLSHPWPMVPTEEGVRILASDGSAPRTVPWNQLKPQVEGSNLRLHENATCSMIHESLAKLWKHRLLEWKTLDAKQRDTAFHKIAEASLDVTNVKERAQEIRETTASMQWNSRLMSLILFLYIPLTYYFEGDDWKTFLGLALLYLLMILQACFLRRYLKHHPTERAQSVSRLLGCLVFPPTAIRLPDWAAVQMAAEVHPLAAHWAWSSRGFTIALAQTMRREASWPVGVKSTSPWQGADVIALERFMLRHQIPLLEASAVVREPSQTQQCPRCLTTYSSRVSVCKDCHGIPLQNIEGIHRNKKS